MQLAFFLPANKHPTSYEDVSAIRSQRLQNLVWKFYQRLFMLTSKPPFTTQWQQCGQAWKLNTVYLPVRFPTPLVYRIGLPQWQNEGKLCTLPSRLLAFRTVTTSASGSPYSGLYTNIKETSMQMSIHFVTINSVTVSQSFVRYVWSGNLSYIPPI